MIGGARKKSNNARNTRNGSAGQHQYSGGPSSKKRHGVGRPTTNIGVSSSSAASATRLENGEIRPPRDVEVGVLSERDEDEHDDNNLSDDNRTRRPSSSHHRGGRGHKNSKGSDPSGDSSSRGILHSSGGGGERGFADRSSIIPPGHVGGPSKSTMDKDELNHIIPESKKFPQVSPIKYTVNTYFCVCKSSMIINIIIFGTIICENGFPIMLYISIMPGCYALLNFKKLYNILEYVLCL